MLSVKLDFLKHYSDVSIMRHEDSYSVQPFRNGLVSITGHQKKFSSQYVYC